MDRNRAGGGDPDVVKATWRTSKQDIRIFAWNHALYKIGTQEEPGSMVKLGNFV